MQPNHGLTAKLSYGRALDPKTQQWESENYAATPPALWVVQGDGTVWTLGLNRRYGPKGEFEFDVLRNNSWTGAWASRIERHQGRIRIFTTANEGTTGRYHYWNGRSFV